LQNAANNAVTEKLSAALAANYGTRPGLLGVLMNSSPLPGFLLSTMIVFEAGASIGGRGFPGSALKGIAERSEPLTTRENVALM
jgi:hypothetical protein